MAYHLLILCLWSVLPFLFLFPSLHFARFLRGRLCTRHYSIPELSHLQPQSLYPHPLQHSETPYRPSFIPLDLLRSNILYNSPICYVYNLNTLVSDIYLMVLSFSFSCKKSCKARYFNQHSLSCFPTNTIGIGLKGRKNIN